MGNKILGLLEGAKNLEGDTLSIEKEAIVNLLKEIPDDIRSEYAEAMVAFANNFLLLRNIFTLDQGSLSFKHLIENLTPIQMQNLIVLARHMASDDRNSKVNEIVRHSIGFSEFSDEKPQP